MEFFAPLSLSTVAFDFLAETTCPKSKLSSKSRDLLSHVISECMQMQGGIVRHSVQVIISFIPANTVNKSKYYTITGN